MSRRVPKLSAHKKWLLKISAHVPVYVRHEGEAAHRTTVGEFCRDNADDSEMCELVIGLPMGESVVFGGGAAPVVEVFRKVGGR